MTAKSTTAPGPVDKKKNHKGQSFKTIWPAKDLPDDAGDSETHPVARRMTKGMRPGTGKGRGKVTQPGAFAERNHKGQSYKTVAPKAERDSGADAAVAKVRNWVAGKRGSYK